MKKVKRENKVVQIPASQLVPGDIVLLEAGDMPPAVVTIWRLAQRLVRKNALIRKVSAVESLGSVTYICSDKTGTLTKYKMTVKNIWVDEQQGSLNAFTAQQLLLLCMGVNQMFSALRFCQMGYVLAIRSEHAYLFRQGIFSNRPLIVAVLLTFALQLKQIYAPVFHDIFSTQSLSLSGLLICLAVSSAVYHAVVMKNLWRSLRGV